MVRFPRVERVGRPEHGAVSLAQLDLARDRRDDAVADLVEHGERVGARHVEGLGPDHARAACLGQLDRHGQSVRRTANRSAGDVIDVQHAAGLFGAEAALVQREHGALRDDEQAAQLREPRDDVVHERVAGAAAYVSVVDRSMNGITDTAACRDPSARTAAPGVTSTAAVTAAARVGALCVGASARRRGSAARRGPRPRRLHVAAATCSSPSRSRLPRARRRE